MTKTEKSPPLNLSRKSTVRDACREIKAAARVIKKAELAKREAQATITQAMGNHNRALVKGFTMTLSTIAGGQVSFFRKPYTKLTVTKQ